MCCACQDDRRVYEKFIDNLLLEQRKERDEKYHKAFREMFDGTADDWWFEKSSELEWKDLQAILKAKL